MAATDSNSSGRGCLVMVALTLISGACSILFLIALVLLDRYGYRILRRMWSNKQRERAISLSQEFPVSPDDLVLVGDTHLADYRWEEVWAAHLDKQLVRNLGIADETVAELNERLAAIIAHQPKALLLHCGGTDIRLGFGASTILSKVATTFSTISEKSPATNVMVLGILPQHPKQAAKIQQANNGLHTLTAQHGYTFLNLFEELADTSGGLRADFSEDGYHLWGKGYQLLLTHVEPSIIQTKEG